MLRMKMKDILILTMSAFCITGCGTICNLASKEPQPYGGLARDLEFANSAQLSAPQSPWAFVGALGICAGEFGASGIADTVTFPFILCYERRKARDNPTKKCDCSMLPAEYSVGAVVPPATPNSADQAIPAEFKELVGK